MCSGIGFTLARSTIAARAIPPNISLFDAVQAKLDENKLARRGKSERSPSAAAWLAL
jgi:hypothetical protein